MAYLPSMQSDNVGSTSGLNIYEQPQLNPLNAIDDGLEPGDITKYSALPWQSVFNECSSQDIDVTYDDWNKLNPSTHYEKLKQQVNTTLWWPAHRPLQVFLENGQQADWARGIPQGKEGDLKMVTAWKWLGFVKMVNIPNGPTYAEVERDDEKLGAGQAPAIPLPPKK